MESWTERVREFLNASPTGAMPLSRLLALLEEPGASPVHGRDRVLQQVACSPESFGLVPDRLGAWIDWPEDDARGPEIPPNGPWGRDPWIVPRQRAPVSLGSEEEIVGRLRECLQAWGEEMDNGSSMAVGRWIEANRVGERSLRMFMARADGAG